LLCNYKVNVKFNYISNAINYNFNYKLYSITCKTVINYN